MGDEGYSKVMVIATQICEHPKKQNQNVLYPKEAGWTGRHRHTKSSYYLVHFANVYNGEGKGRASIEAGARTQYWPSTSLPMNLPGQGMFGWGWLSSLRSSEGLTGVGRLNYKLNQLAVSRVFSSFPCGSLCRTAMT